jgi:hypothetical protein
MPLYAAHESKQLGLHTRLTNTAAGGLLGQKNNNMNLLAHSAGGRTVKWNYGDYKAPGIYLSTADCSKNPLLSQYQQGLEFILQSTDGRTKPPGFERNAMPPYSQKLYTPCTQNTIPRHILTAGCTTIHT